MVHGKSGLTVIPTETFDDSLARLCREDRRVILEFHSHLDYVGLIGLPGRLKRSDHVDTDRNDWLERVQLVREYNLWHYHVGIPSYDRRKPRGDWTSQTIVHLSITDTTVVLIDIDSHPPFMLPDRLVLRQI